jgi:hypothetical protein
MNELNFRNRSKNKSKDGRASMQNEQTADNDLERSAAPVSKGRKISTYQLLLHSSVAQVQLNIYINLLNKSNDCKYHYL